MTEEERKQAFMTGYEALAKQYGFELAPAFTRIQPVKVGLTWRLEADTGLELVPLQNWQAPSEDTHD